MRILVPAVAAAALLVVAAAAHASDFDLLVCGSGKTVTLSNPAAQRVPLTYRLGLHGSAPAPIQPYYEIQITVGGSSCEVPNLPTDFYVPGAGEVRIHGNAGNAFWLRLPPALAKLLARATRDLKPFPAPRTLESASVDHSVVARPSSYLRLYAIGTPVGSAPSAGGWLPITLLGAASPWTDGSNALFVSRRGSYLERDGQIVRVPAATAKRIREAESLPR